MSGIATARSIWLARRIESTARSNSGHLLPRGSPNLRVAYYPEHTLALFHRAWLVGDETGLSSWRLQQQEQPGQSSGQQSVPHTANFSPVSQTKRAARPARGLWWSVTTGKTVSARATVRNRTRRRFRAVFLQALRDAGFDADGVSWEEGREAGVELRGSLVVYLAEGSVVAPREELYRDAEGIVSRLGSPSVKWATMVAGDGKRVKWKDNMKRSSSHG